MQKKYKLTLSVDAATAKRAKLYARRRKTSVTKLVTNYLQRLTKRDRQVQPQDDFFKNLHPSVREIAGIISEENLAKAEKNLRSKLKKKHF